MSEAIDNKLPFSKDLKEILDKIHNDIIIFYPSEIISVEHLIISILESKKSHAGIILTTLLTSNTLLNLTQEYQASLKKKTNPNARIDKTKVDFDYKVNAILEDAEKEAKRFNKKEIGSEHVLLSMLNSKNNTGIDKVFNELGVNYDIVNEKCQNNKTNEIKEHNNLKYPTKGEINIQATSSKNVFVKKYTTNINELYQKGKTDALVGREKEIRRIIKTLARRKKNNAVLVGQSGCGSSQIVYGLAELIEKKQVPEILLGKQVVMLNISALMAGTTLRGMLEERLNGLFDELISNKNYILFIDDVQNVLKSGSKDKDSDISGSLITLLTDGNVKVLATTNFKEYRNAIENNSQISKNFQKIVVEPNTVEETVTILNNIKQRYEDFHNVKYTDEAIRKIPELAKRYITNRVLPDSAIDVLDTVGANTCFENRYPQEILEMKERLLQMDSEKEELLNNGDFELIDSLTKEENEIKKKINDFNRNAKRNNESFCIKIDVDKIYEIISDMTDIPISNMAKDDKKSILNINNVLKETIIGQDEPIDSICRVIKRNKVGLGNKNKVICSALLIGGSGIGKTLLAKKIANEIYGSENALIRIDMSEYSEKSSISKLIGTSAGFIGFENGGLLTEAVKNKQYCVLLLDEIEKANDEIFNLFLQLFDEGRLTDGSGQLINFKNVMVLMTSNVGAKQASEQGKPLGFTQSEEENKRNIIEKQLKKKFAPEFLNRIDKIIYFNQLTDENLEKITILELKKLVDRLKEIGYNLTYDDKVINHISKKAIEQKEYGARPILRIIQDEIEDKVTDIILSDEDTKNIKITIGDNNEVVQI